MSFPRSLKGNLLSSGWFLILVYFNLYFSSYPKIIQKFVRFFLFCSPAKLLGCLLDPVHQWLILTFACLDMDSDYSGTNLYHCFSLEAFKEEFKEALKWTSVKLFVDFWSTVYNCKIVTVALKMKYCVSVLLKYLIWDRVFMFIERCKK